jgi:hypothetical protein
MLAGFVFEGTMVLRGGPLASAADLLLVATFQKFRNKPSAARFVLL